MKAITLRNIPPDVARTIRKRAAEEKTSLNKVVISLLQENISGPGKVGKVKHTDLDRFFGTWTREDYEEFEKALAEQRQIDPEMWK